MESRNDINLENETNKLLNKIETIKKSVTTKLEEISKFKPVRSE